MASLSFHPRRPNQPQRKRPRVSKWKALKPQRYKLINGEEETEYDDIEFGDVVLDFINSNECVTFEWKGKPTENGILTVEVS
jgi:hypothetical protein